MDAMFSGESVELVSLREYYAGIVAQGLVQCGHINEKFIAAMAVQVADKLIEELYKHETRN